MTYLNYLVTNDVSKIVDRQAIYSPMCYENGGCIDDLIIFQHLTEKEIAEIVKIQLKDVIERLHKKDITFEITDEALAYLAKAGFDPVYGARPLKRLIQNEILDELSLQVIEGKLMKGHQVNVDYGNGKVVFKVKSLHAVHS
jgi:ATP-dependent Clp protease ATP-binding subunit ClpA